MIARPILLFLLLVLAACARSPLRLDNDFDRARQDMWRGEFASAKQVADGAAARVAVEVNPIWHWRFRLLSSEIAILMRDFQAAERVVKSPLPNAPAFDSLRARQ